MKGFHPAAQCRVDFKPWSRCLDLWIFQKDHDGKVSVATDFEMKPLALNELATPPPAFSLSMLAGQELMDELWRCGLRPTEGTGSAGALAATQKHLEDMRTLVFKEGDK